MAGALERGLHDPFELYAKQSEASLLEVARQRGTTPDEIVSNLEVQA
jgi:hypothetical protein